MKTHAEIHAAANGVHVPDDLADEELVMHLEPDQFVSATSQPVPRALLHPRTTAALWALRVFVVIVSAMVLYTFIAQLH